MSDPMHSDPRTSNTAASTCSYCCSSSAKTSTLSEVGHNQHDHLSGSSSAAAHCCCSWALLNDTLHQTQPQKEPRAWQAGLQTNPASKQQSVNELIHTRLYSANRSPPVASSPDQMTAGDLANQTNSSQIPATFRALAEGNRRRPSKYKLSRPAISASVFEPDSCDGKKPTSAEVNLQQVAPEDNKRHALHMDWKDIARKYGRMPATQGRSQWRYRQSYLCHLLINGLQAFFPIVGSFNHYSLPKDLISDLVAGFTIGVLHIPQGMAYGLLAGVEPVYGLYVSLVPVLVMALMSKSRHVSYGSFAVVSMLLVSATQNIKQAIREHHQLDQLPVGTSRLLVAGASSDPFPGVVVTDNHQPIDRTDQSLLKDIIAHKPFQAASAESDLQLSLENSTGSGVWQAGQVNFVMPSNAEILASLTALVGIIQVLMSLVRMGSLSLMFSDQLVSGYTTASAIHVLTSQLGGLIDADLPPLPEVPFKVFRIWWMFITQLTEDFNTLTGLMSLASILFLLVVKEFVEPKLKQRYTWFPCLPSELVLMSTVIFCSWYWNFHEEYDIKIVGAVPTGLPKLQSPNVNISLFVFQDALTIALVTFAINLSLAQVYARKYKYKIDANQELLALGSANAVGSLFLCFPCASSLSRSAVLSRLNPKSQMSSLISCSVVVLIICYMAPILHDLPRSTLSCIIVVALKGILSNSRDFLENWRRSKLDAFVWIFTFIAVLAVNVTYGLVLGITASLFMIFFRLLNPCHSILGQLPGTEIYVDKSAFAECSEIDQVKIFRFNSPLCYLNKTMFKSNIEKLLPSVYKRDRFNLCPPAYGHQQQVCTIDGNKSASSDRIKYLIIDCSALAYCDYSGAGTLVDIIEELEESGVHVYLAACPLKFINMIEKLQKIELLEHNIFPSIGDAVGMVKYLESRYDTSRLIRDITK